MTTKEDPIANTGMFLQLPKPNWPDWERVHHCPLWEAAALACDVDPAIYRPHGLTANASRDSVLTTVPDDLRALLTLAQSAVASGTLKVPPIGNSTLMQSEVELSAFTTWLRMLGQPIPKGFPWTARELTSGAHQWPWGSYQTKDLQLLAQAADKFWKNYDPKDHLTAPTNETVVAWLESKSVSKRKAEVMASLLRADDLPTGPRKER